MTSREKPETGDHPANDVQSLLVLAHTRLFLLPVRGDGSKQATIASFGHLDVRLVQMPLAVSTPMILQLWVELYDSAGDRVIDSVGCRNLQKAASATDAFVADAERLNACR